MHGAVILIRRRILSVSGDECVRGGGGREGNVGAVMP